MMKPGGKAPYDLILSFIFSRDDMAVSLEEVDEKRLLTSNRRLYMAYPKKSFAFEVKINDCFQDTALMATDSFKMSEEYYVIGFRNTRAAMDYSI